MSRRTWWRTALAPQVSAPDPSGARGSPPSHLGPAAVPPLPTFGQEAPLVSPPLPTSRPSALVASRWPHRVPALHLLLPRAPPPPGLLHPAFPFTWERGGTDGVHVSSERPASRWEPRTWPLPRSSPRELFTPSSVPCPEIKAGDFVPLVPAGSHVLYVLRVLRRPRGFASFLPPWGAGLEHRTVAGSRAGPAVTPRW